MLLNTKLYMCMTKLLEVRQRRVMKLGRLSAINSYEKGDLVDGGFVVHIV